jgi:hypothetical protein
MDLARPGETAERRSVDLSALLPLGKLIIRGKEWVFAADYCGGERLGAGW